MSPRDWSTRAADLLEAIEEIESFVAGMTFEQFADDARTCKAVLADFTIIGEAAMHLPPEVTSTAPQIEWTQIRRMRNIIVHVYFGVDFRIVWQTIPEDLPPLKAVVRRFVSEENA